MCLTATDFQRVISGLSLICSDFASSGDTNVKLVRVFNPDGEKISFMVPTSKLADGYVCKWPVLIM